ncbi:DUF4870 family protein [Zavarzinia compransoris]|nr:hypothetical protein [Zavarzinia compransoris]TDP44479.1 putative membrane protein [Zavarzinia compransoris]
MTTLPPALPDQREEDLRTLAMIAHGCMAASFLNGITFFIAVIIAYVKRAEAAGTPYESHFASVIRTFWIGFVLSVIGILTSVIFVGLFILFGTFIYVLVKAVIGLIKASERKPL